MDKTVEHQIRELAQPLWESAARPYGMALDFWLMAEQMVVEMMTATARFSESAAAATSFRPPWEAPEEAPVTRIRELAELMWEAAGRQYGMAQDFWLSAERHILAMMRAATGTDDDSRRYYQELAALSPSAYMDRIRLTAYYMWESTGRQYGQALDFWLLAEQKTLESLAGAAASAGYPGVQSALQPADDAPAAADADTVVPQVAATAMTAAASEGHAPAVASPANEPQAEPAPRAEPVPAKATSADEAPTKTSAGKARAPRRKRTEPAAS